MLEYILIGAGFAFAAGAQPGPLQAFLLTRAAAEGWRHTLPAALSPLLSDGPIALLTLLVVGRLPLTAQHALRLGGGLLLLYLAGVTVRQLRRASGTHPARSESGHRTLLQAALVNLLNPNPYLGWALVLGPAATQAWHERPANAVALVLAFYLTMVCTLAVFIVLAAGARFLGPHGRRWLVLVSALVLAILGIYQLVVGAQQLLHGALTS